MLNYFDSTHDDNYNLGHCNTQSLYRHGNIRKYYLLNLITSFFWRNKSRHVLLTHFNRSWFLFKSILVFHEHVWLHTIKPPTWNVVLCIHEPPLRSDEFQSEFKNNHTNTIKTSFREKYIRLWYCYDQPAGWTEFKRYNYTVVTMFAFYGKFANYSCI